MNKLKLLLLLIAILVNTSCASFGPTVRIETPVPADDFLVYCDWYADKLFSLHGGPLKKTDEKVYVTHSGVELSCGMSLWGGKGTVVATHPLYIGGTSATIDGVTVITMQTKKPQYLDELNDKFESGYWDNHKWPDSTFIRNIRGVCLRGFDHYFRNYLTAVDSFDFVAFKNKYYQPILDCKRKESEFLSDNKIRDRMRKKYVDPENILKIWWDKKEIIANEYK